MQRKKERQGLSCFGISRPGWRRAKGDEGESDRRVEKGDEATLSQGGPDRSHFSLLQGLSERLSILLRIIIIIVRKKAMGGLSKIE